MLQPRATDDFAAIRARMKELRRERDKTAGVNDRDPAARPNTYASGSRARDGSNLAPAIKRILGRYR
jgi:hypothetical protein